MSSRANSDDGVLPMSLSIADVPKHLYCGAHHVSGNRCSLRTAHSSTEFVDVTIG
jgi:hypothetical protein